MTAFFAERNPQVRGCLGIAHRQLFGFTVDSLNGGRDPGPA